MRTTRWRLARRALTRSDLLWPSLTCPVGASSPTLLVPLTSPEFPSTAHRPYGPGSSPRSGMSLLVREVVLLHRGPTTTSRTLHDFPDHERLLRGPPAVPAKLDQPVPPHALTSRRSHREPQRIRVPDSQDGTVLVFGLGIPVCEYKKVPTLTKRQTPAPFPSRDSLSLHGAGRETTDKEPLQ